MPRKKKTIEPQYISATECARRSGFTSRYFTRLAPKVSWARQPGGHDTKWVFEVRGFEAWFDGGLYREPKKLIPRDHNERPKPGSRAARTHEASKQALLAMLRRS